MRKRNDHPRPSLPKPAGNFWTPARVALTVLVLALAAALGVSSCNSNDPTSTGPAVSVKVAPSGKAPNEAAPAALTVLPTTVLDAELQSISGNAIKLSDYSGRVILVNLWATWCGPCRIETPELVKLHKQYVAKGVEMIGLSTENPDASADSVREFVKAYQVDYRIGWATPEVALTLMQGRDAIPQSFVIGRDGRIVRRFVGFNPTMTPPQIKQAIEEALNAKT
jgi:thiol-disulfide isomerase/thioredoxin